MERTLIAYNPKLAEVLLSKANVLINKTDYGYAIKVEGRASMECSPSLKNFGENFVAGAFSKVVFDMKECQWMDSTFMGTLAMLGIKAKKADIAIEMVNMNEKLISLIRDLGIESLFKIYADSSLKFDSAGSYSLCSPDGSSAEDASNTILKAHESLVEASEGNASKFGKVIEMVKKDIKDSSL